MGAQTTDNGWAEFRAAASQLAPLSLKSLNPWDTHLPQALRELAPKSIVVVGLTLCGYPYPLMQAIDAGCTVLVALTGGVDELIPKSFHEQVSFRIGSGDSLLVALRRKLELSSNVRSSQNSALRLSLLRQHESALALLTPRHSSLQSNPVAAALHTGEPPVTVIVPVFNRPFCEIEDLIIGINRQTLPPFEVIFVDNASHQDFAKEHAQRVSTSLNVPARFIRHSVNKGLAAARNTGLQACKTEFVAMHDSDNVAANDFLYRGCLSLIENPDVEAVNFEMMSFRDGTDWKMHDPFREYYRPVGDGLVKSLGHINWFGDAMGIYRVEGLRQTGGWDETDRGMWEDLALFIKWAASGDA